MSLESRVRELEESTPSAYQTFDSDGAVVISSNLPALKWFNAAITLFQSPGREEEKAILHQQLARSRSENGGGKLWQVVLALAEGPFEQDSSETPAS